MKRVLSMLTALVTVGAGLTVGAPAAQAAGSCSGTITYSQVQSSGLGELVIYYNSSNGGTNSACFYHRGPSYGVAAYTYVMIYRCSQRSGEGQTCNTAVAGGKDSGTFSYQAGPVGVTGTANYCVGATGWITWEHPNPDVGKMHMGVEAPLTRGC